MGYYLIPALGIPVSTSGFPVRIPVIRDCGREHTSEAHINYNSFNPHTQRSLTQNNIRK